MGSKSEKAACIGVSFLVFHSVNTFSFDIKVAPENSPVGTHNKTSKRSPFWLEIRREVSEPERVQGELALDRYR